MKYFIVTLKLKEKVFAENKKEAIAQMVSSGFKKNEIINVEGI